MRKKTGPRDQRIVTPEMLLEMRALRAEGQSIMQVADAFGIGETTAFRALKGYGAYSAMKREADRAETATTPAAVEASFARLQELLKEEGK